MRALVGLLAWLAIRAGANVAPSAPHWGSAPMISAAARAAELGPTVRPDRAGSLVPVPEETLEPNRPLAHWALLSAVTLVVLIVAAGYLRRRWKAHAQGTRPPRPAWQRNSGRKS